MNEVVGPMLRIDEEVLAAAPATARSGPDEVVDPAKVVRLAIMVDAVVADTPEGALDAHCRDRLRDVTSATLIELGSTLSDPLLEELGRVAGPLAAGATDDEVRLAGQQLAGWIHGLLSTL